MSEHVFSTTNIGRDVTFDLVLYECRTGKEYTKQTTAKITSMSFSVNGEYPSYYKLSNGWLLGDKESYHGTNLMIDINNAIIH